MITIIGTDEAGYGPNLGALCVSGTRWQIERADSESLPDQLRGELDPLCRKNGIFPVLDSKKLYHSSGSLAPLEKTILITLFLLDGKFPSKLDCRQFFQRVIKEKFPRPSKISKIERSPKNRQLTIFDSLAFENQCDSEPSLNSSPNHNVNFPADHHSGDSLLLTNTKNFGQDKIPEETPIWERDVNFPLPVALSLPTPILTSSPPDHSSENDLQNDALKTRGYLMERAIKLDAVQTRRIQPALFNARLAEGLLKSDILAETTLDIVRDLLPEISDSSSNTAKTDKVYVLCDKLGGRNNYRPVLSQFFPEYKITVFSESRNISNYLMIPCDTKKRSPLEIRFQMKGEINHPTALASIFSKYLRELSMIFFNDFWRRQIPQIIPTAGYPVDAKRFYSEIHDTQCALGISDLELWRNK